MITNSTVTAAATEEQQQNQSVTSSAHIDGDVDAQVAIVGKKLCDICVKDETVTGVYSCLDTIVNTTRCCLPRQPPFPTIELQSVSQTHPSTRCQP